jgi:hypothetical protein
MHRPAARYLTAFYLWMSVGGVLGGLFNALVAPLVFRSVAEYPLVLVIACLLLPRPAAVKDRTWSKWLDLAIPVGFVAIGGLLLWGVARGLVDTGRYPANPIIGGLLCALPVLAFPFVGRPIRLGLSVGALTLLGAANPVQKERTLLTDRSFFGVHRVLVDRKDEFHMLVHGNTNHGIQSLDPARNREPLSYFTHTGPLGQLFDAFSGPRIKRNIAVLGLGSGTIACYVGPDQQLTFYEIDPLVLKIARDPDYFTFLTDCPGKVDIVLGDGRLTLRGAPEHSFDVIIADAFSSDSIPLHLVTREALQLYLSRLKANGIVVFQISNRYLDLEPVLGDLAADADLVCMAQVDLNVTEEQARAGKTPSHFVVMAHRWEDMGGLENDSRWRHVSGRSSVRIWTDDFSNIFSVIRTGQLAPLPGSSQ